MYVKIAASYKVPNMQKRGNKKTVCVSAKSFKNVGNKKEAVLGVEVCQLVDTQCPLCLPT